MSVAETHPQVAPADTPAAKIIALPTISDRPRVDECIIVIRRPFRRTISVDGTDSICLQPDCGRPWRRWLQNVWGHCCAADCGRSIFTDGEYLYGSVQEAQIGGADEQRAVGR